MRKFLSIMIFILLSININYTNALEIEYSENDTTKIENQIKKEVSREDVFIFFADFFEATPKSYKYIDLNFTGVEKGSKLEDSLKKLVYHDKLDNSKTNIYPEKNINSYAFYYLSRDILDIDMNLNKSTLLKKYTTEEDLVFIKNTFRYLEEEEKAYIEHKNFNALGNKKQIFDDIYSTITNEHYKKAEISNEDLIYSAIEGLANGAGDQHTVYFPPVENKSFAENLEGEYEGIGAYVEMSKPGEVKITSPVPGGPAEKSGIKGGDIITKVNDREVSEENSLEEVTSWIKGEKGTKVTLTILRKGEEIKIDVVRDKIVIKNLEYKKLNSSTFYIKIKSFGSHIAQDFQESLLELKKDKNTKKVIIDLRNNGGGYLDQVVKMLGYVIDEGEKVAVVKYDKFKQYYYSNEENIIDLNNYEIVILQNSGTASASEIMIGTLKDYFNVYTIGEKTYGKGSVQTIKEYSDGSSFKYTIANWYTGGTETGIDGKGIEADEIIELDIEMLNNGEDNQLNEAIKK